MVLACGGLYPAVDTVECILNPQEGVQKWILDLGKAGMETQRGFANLIAVVGTGTGIW